MYIPKKTRARVYAKFNGRCAYTGTKLNDDWQIDHIKPLIRDCDGLPDPLIGGKNTIENMVPTQRIVNHYKGSLDLELFRNWYLAGLHERLKKLPKNPKVEKSKRRKKYLLEVAELFGITPDKPFSGKFYFETLNKPL